MATFVFGMNLSLDGYVDHQAFAPDPVLFRHWIHQMRGLTGSIYGRRIYEIMRYWEVDDPAWSGDEREFAIAWRRQPKWIVSRTLASTGPNATLVATDIDAVMRRLKAQQDGEIAVAGPVLAAHLAQLDLIDEYRLYFHPVVLGGGDRFFAGPRPPLRLIDSQTIGPQVVQLTYRRAHEDAASAKPAPKAL